MSLAQRRARPFTAIAGGLRIKVRLTPKSGHDRIEGIEEAADGSVLKVRVRAALSAGAANAALSQVLATWLGVPKSSIAVVAGARQRLKTLVITGESLHLANLVSARLADPSNITRQAR